MSNVLVFLWEQCVESKVEISVWSAVFRPGPQSFRHIFTALSMITSFEVSLDVRCS